MKKNTAFHYISLIRCADDTETKNQIEQRQVKYDFHFPNVQIIYMC